MTSSPFGTTKDRRRSGRKGRRKSREDGMRGLVKGRSSQCLTVSRYCHLSLSLMLMFAGLVGGRVTNSGN